VYLCYYDLEVCPLKQLDIRSLDFAANRLFIKLFWTSDTNIVEYVAMCFTSNHLVLH